VIRGNPDAGDLDRETFRDRKANLQEEVRDLESRTADHAAKLGHAQERVALALKLAQNCHTTYGKGLPRPRNSGTRPSSTRSSSGIGQW
jgi:hypothetical protein